MAPCNGWWDCVVPQDATGIWTAVGALATGLVAVLAYKISRVQLFLEATPIIILTREDAKTFTENVGRGVALTVIACGDDGDIVDEFGALRPTEKRDVRLSPNLSVSNALYYRGSTGQWFRSKVTGRSITGDEKRYPVDTEFRKIRRRQLPRSVRLRLKRHARSAYEQLEQLSSLITLEAWTNRVTARRTRLRRKGERWYYSIGESRRLAKFAKYADQAREVAQPPETRKTWEFDLQGIAQCWHTSAIDVQHFGCFEQDDGALICEIGLGYIAERVRGLAVIGPRSRSSLMALPQSARSDIAWERLSAYVCGRLPKERFVFEV